ncbi:MAG: choice-of-anchor L domain-containing protein [Bryobacteraceae bacterium]
MNRIFVTLGQLACVSVLAATASATTLIVTQTTDGTALATALGGGGGLTIDSASVTNGAASQSGTYTGFTSPPVTTGDGVVLSTGKVVDTTADSYSFLNFPSTNTGASGTPEFDAYGPGHISSFGGSNDVAALMVHFTLSSDSQVGFDFIFGSVEYPTFIGSFTDSFLAFLDGTAVADQIVFDASNQAVQVGSTFSSALTTEDTNSAFADPHGLLQLQTFTNTLSAGSHTIIFEVGDVNDHLLDSAVFLSKLHAGPGPIGTASSVPEVPEPGTLALFGIGLGGLIAGRRRKKP